jgi:hypothetical protein
MVNLVGAFIGLMVLVYFAWDLAVKRWWYSPVQVKRRVWLRVGNTVARGVLLDAFNMGHRRFERDDVFGWVEKVQTVRFIGPAHECVMLSEPKHDSPYLVTVREMGQYVTKAVWRVNLEVDLIRLPVSVDKIIRQGEAIENQIAAVTKARDVEVNHYWLGDKGARRLIIAVKFEQRRKEGTIPDFVGYVEVMSQRVTELSHKNQLREQKQATLTKRLLLYGLEHYDGQFPLKKLQAQFADEVSHRQIETLARELQDEGILAPTAGPRPRRINPDMIANLHG